ncbi:hypothetical protein Sjap_012754 [Stephania japonica]|uniref:Uncharacterized protein n=1 Tax=Stephania japonica TaxID=461633 RepID=A0AAP0IYK6_9MAGN
MRSRFNVVDQAAGDHHQLLIEFVRFGDDGGDDQVAESAGGGDHESGEAESGDGGLDLTLKLCLRRTPKRSPQQQAAGDHHQPLIEFVRSGDDGDDQVAESAGGGDHEFGEAESGDVGLDLTLKL